MSTPKTPIGDKISQVIDLIFEKETGKKTSHGAVAHFSRRFNYPKDRIGKYKAGQQPSAEFLSKFLSDTGVSASWLLLDEGEIFDAPPKIKFWNRLHFSAGGGGLVEEEEQFEMLELPVAINERMVDAQKIEGVLCRGDSMEPLINDNVIVLFRHDGRLINERPHVLRHKNQLLIKGIVQTQDGFNLLSANKNYVPVSVKKGDDFQVFGEVLCQVKDLR